MGEPKDCPRCRLGNPPAAEQCDCGYDFVERRVVGSARPRAAPGAFGCGTALALGFVLVSLGSVVGAVIGVHYLLATVKGPDGASCGLWVIGVIAEGLICGAFLGALAGVVVTVLAVLSLRRPV